MAILFAALRQTHARSLIHHLLQPFAQRLMFTIAKPRLIQL
jgi:hypothetical protein